jgi:uncharacterized GH25 family protein
MWTKYDGTVARQGQKGLDGKEIRQRREGYKDMKCMKEGKIKGERNLAGLFL